LVLQDTPICDANAFETIKTLASSHEMTDRFKRVTEFLEYLRREEDKEYTVVMGKSNSIPLRNRFVPVYTASVEADMGFIRDKVTKRGFARWNATPYVDVGAVDSVNLSE
jgi:hypothetical protein